MIKSTPFWPTLAASILVLASLHLSSCAQSKPEAEPTVQAPLTAADEQRIAPVRALLAALEAKDAVAIRNAFTDNATQAYRAESWKTPDRFKRWLESDIISRNGFVANPVFSFEGDNGIVVKGQYTSTGYQSPANFLFTVENGKVASWRMRY